MSKKNRPSGLKYKITKSNPTWFKKGNIPYNKGIPATEESKQLTSIKTKEAMTSEIKQLISIKTKIAMQNPEIREKCRYWLGKTMSKEVKQKMGQSRMGEKHFNWKGGLSFEPYPIVFTRVLKAKIRARDNYTCQLCGIIEQESLIKYGRILSINHIDFNKQNCSEDNLNALCCSCNAKVNFNREYWTRYFMENKDV